MILLKMPNNSIRWIFNISKFNPSRSDMLLASSCLQPEEKERLARFYFKKDCSSSLIGRLMMRKFVSDHSEIPYNEIKFARDDKSKPFLVNRIKHPVLNFNVSHQGDYTVLAGEIGDVQLGVDIMKIDFNKGKEWNNYFRLMSKQFSAHECQTIKNAGDLNNQIKMFYRHWCLKESYVKAVGVGITIDLREISFRINTKNINKEIVTVDTELFMNGEKIDWVFQELMLDDNHCVAIAINKNVDNDIKFKQLTFDDLMLNCKPLSVEDTDFSDNYFKKGDKL